MAWIYTQCKRWNNSLVCFPRCSEPCCSRHFNPALANYCSLDNGRLCKRWKLPGLPVRFLQPMGWIEKQCKRWNNSLVCFSRCSEPWCIEHLNPILANYCIGHLGDFFISQPKTFPSSIIASFSFLTCSRIHAQKFGVVRELADEELQEVLLLLFPWKFYPRWLASIQKCFGVQPVKFPGVLGCQWDSFKSAPSLWLLYTREEDTKQDAHFVEIFSWVWWREKLPVLLSDTIFKSFTFLCNFSTMSIEFFCSCPTKNVESTPSGR